MRLRLLLHPRSPSQSDKVALAQIRRSEENLVPMVTNLFLVLLLHLEAVEVTRQAQLDLAVGRAGLTVWPPVREHKIRASQVLLEGKASVPRLVGPAAAAAALAGKDTPRLVRTIPSNTQAVLAGLVF